MITKSTPPDLDPISTAEVTGNVEIEESQLVLGGLISGVSEDTLNFNVVRVLDGVHEREVIVEEIEREAWRDISTEVADIVKNAGTGVCSKDGGDNENNSTDVTDCGLESDGRLLEDTQEIELPVFEEVLIEHICTLNGEEISTAGYMLSSGAFLLPHPSKEFRGGEDACFIAGRKWLGVADGVSSWAEIGINSGIFARELMGNCLKIVSDYKSNSLTNPKEVLKQSVLEARSPASSTILVAYFDGQALHVANIGDSGFIVIRNGAVYKKSSPRSFSFNCPHQVESGSDPSRLVKGYRIDLEEGDVIITATDGLFDNLYEEEIVSIVSKSLQSNLKPEEIAESLAKRAQEVGNSESWTPFADAAEEAGEEECTGGKLDDVTVIASLVQKRSGPLMERTISKAGYILSTGASLLPHPYQVRDGAPSQGLEATKTVHDEQTSDPEASGHGAVELDSETSVNGEKISTAGYILSTGDSSLPHLSQAQDGAPSGGLEAQKTVGDGQSSDPEASGDGVVNLDSETAVDGK